MWGDGWFQYFAGKAMCNAFQPSISCNSSFPRMPVALNPKSLVVVQKLEYLPTLFLHTLCTATIKDLWELRST